MYLIVAGSTETVRALVVDEFLNNHEDWRHLALEDIQDVELEEHEDVIGFQETFMTMVACDCARQARAEGNHVIITCPDLDMLHNVYDELDDVIKSVFVQSAGEEVQDFDLVIDGSESSMTAICKQLEELIEATPA